MKSELKNLFPEPTHINMVNLGKPILPQNNLVKQRSTHISLRESALKTYNSKTASPEEKAQAAKDYYKAKDRAEAAGANNDYTSRGPRD